MKPTLLPHASFEIDVNSHSTGQSSLGEPGSPRTTQVQGERFAGSRTLLFATNACAFGGTEQHLLELIKRFDQSEVQPIILQLGADVYTDYLKEKGSHRVTILSGKIRNSVWDWFRFFRKTRPGVVVFVNNVVMSFPWHAYVAARLAGVRRRYAIQHLIADPVPAKVEGRPIRNALRRLLGRAPGIIKMEMAARLCNKIICVCDAVRGRLVNDYRFPADRTITIHNGVSVSEFVPCERNRAALRARLGLDSEEFLLVCVARLSEQKRIDILLLAMAQALRGGACCKCIVVGDGPLRGQLSAQAVALGLSGHVFFEGYQKSVLQYLQAADAFVLTSHAEGLPLSILEAMACGLPCVVTDVGGNSEAITHGTHGLVVSPGSVDAVANAISYLVTHPHERAEMSKIARARVREVFDIGNQMAEIKRAILS